MIDSSAPNENRDCWKQIGVWGDCSCSELKQFVHCKNCPVFTQAGRSLLEREAPAEYLEEWKQILARPKQNDPSGLLSVVIFRIGANWLAMDTKYFREVTELRPVHRIPHRSRTLLRGLVNIRGELQLCCSISKLLGMTEADADNSVGRMIVIEKNKDRWVFAVDQIHGTENISPPLSKTALQKPFRWEDKDISYLQPDLLFEELRRLAL
jgi:chemotaxis-related protein WspD